MAYETGNRSITASFGQRLADLRDTATEAYNNWRVYHRTLRELQDLSNRELADLGISRSTVTRIAMEAAYGKNV
ncbi:DUF1127 domain-containing protein [Gymnodinialimonas sp. 57CJ19]|uniref:DUF1127 domain-containing protein n=1 Tax=Gymnodinialimonas sp. 57CJ19 TaxID=3138498 RepID=UPI00313444CB